MFEVVLPISFVLALVVTLSIWNQRGSSIKASSPMPDVTFDFQHSYLSTFTALVALLNALNFSGLALNNDVSFSILNLFFAALVALAPLVYRALGTPAGKETVAGFMLACGATLWAAFGVVFSLGLILSQAIQTIGGQAVFAPILMMAVIALALPLIAAYAHARLSSLLRSSKALAGGATFL
ncbi:MAG TPA: hypothetical protein VI688_04235 [Anaerolineales bacterium]|nr:hypothetical protein [Anaerolineales bacterium]HLE73429.1 hypothetical protein [Anaerolineales bacterium]